MGFAWMTLPVLTPARASFLAIVLFISWNHSLIPLVVNDRTEFMSSSSAAPSVGAVKGKHRPEL
jgi:ABC-type glycerol-3-phosphate transport system permease component